MFAAPRQIHIGKRSASSSHRDLAPFFLRGAKRCKTMQRQARNAPASRAPETHFRALLRPETTPRDGKNDKLCNVRRAPTSREGREPVPGDKLRKLSAPLLALGRPLHGSAVNDK